MLPLNSKLLFSSLITLCLVVAISVFVEATPLNYQIYTEQTSTLVSPIVEPSHHSNPLKTDTEKVETLVHRGCSVEISHQKPYLQVKHRPIAVSQDTATGNYFSPEIPYHQFATLLELGQAYIDAQGKDCGG